MTRFALAVTTALAVPAPLHAAPVDIPFEQFTLPNGLRVVVHTDRKAPIVAVNVTYHVGSKNEPRGRSGFAHLFEHLMFESSEHHRGEYFEPFELIGATEQSGSTDADHTNYLENVPTTALDVALWMESDRMGHLISALDQASIDKQRGVVQNEKRQGENQPYGMAYAMYLHGAFPADHPYHHRTIGSMNDLDAATLGDVKNWFRSWYGPNNAVLVLAGDIDLATARDKVTRYFGDIPPTANLPRLAPRIAARTTATHATATDHVPQTRIYKVWNVPPFGSAELDRLAVVSQVLVDSQSSRLARRLEFTEPLADTVSSSLWALEIAGMFVVEVDVKAGVDPAVVDAAIDDEVARLAARGPTADEVARARAALVADFARATERTGWYRGKADVLAKCALFTGNPGCFRSKLSNIESTTAAQAQAVTAAWLRRGAFTLRIDPGERTPVVEEPTVANLPATVVAPPAQGLRALASTLDRSLGVPKIDSFPALRFPAVTRATLGNGLQVVLAERHGLPVVQLSLELPGAGFASDLGHKPGTAGFALAMLEQGAGRDDALAFAARKEALGAELHAAGTLDRATVTLSAMSPRLGEALALLGDVILRPRLDASDLERVRGAWLASIKQDKATPATLARRLAGPALYGAGHPYAIPPSGTGTEAGIAAITRDELAGWLAHAFRPDNATLIVVGDTSLAELVPALEAAFAGWTAPAAPRPAYAVPAVKRPARPCVLLVDQPGAVQANILVGEVVAPSTDAGAIDLEQANAVLGGAYNSRSDKHWAYTVWSQVTDAVGPRAWTASAAVQIDKAAESAREIQREIAEYATAKAPATPGELTRLRAAAAHALPGSYETGDAVIAMLRGIALHHRPDDYPQLRAARIAGLTLDRLQAAAKAIEPNALTWIIVGDLAKIEAPIRALGLGDVQIVDGDGRVLR